MLSGIDYEIALLSKRYQTAKGMNLDALINEKSCPLRTDGATIIIVTN